MFGDGCTCSGIRPNKDCPRHGWTDGEVTAEFSATFTTTPEGEAFLEKLYGDSVIAGIVQNAEVKDSMQNCFESMAKVKREFDRQNQLYVIASPHIPDDAFAVLYVRPEDAARIKRDKKPQ